MQSPKRDAAKVHQMVTDFDLGDPVEVQAPPPDQVVDSSTLYNT